MKQFWLETEPKMRRISSEQACKRHTHHSTKLLSSKNPILHFYPMHSTKVATNIYNPTTSPSQTRLYTITVAFPIPPVLATPFLASRASKF
jgi:hypothetical protein